MLVIMITNNDNKELLNYLAPLLPANWFEGPPSVIVDEDEILIKGTLLETGPGGKDAEKFRDLTRKERMQIAKQIQPVLKRSVAWGVVVDGATTLFTGLGVPVMTRLRITERDVLDTLVATGVAKSRSDAVSWCVRFVGQREVAWLNDLRDSLESVSKVRAAGPSLA
jgi:hypothetical protein